MKTGKQKQHYTISDIKRMNKESGQDYFQPNTVRLFGSRALPDVYQGPGGVYFVTSEQFDEKSPRLYTVRRFYPESGKIDTVGEFCALPKSVATNQAQELAK